MNVVMLRLAPHAGETVVAREIRRWKHREAYTRVDIDEILVAKLIATSAGQIFIFTRHPRRGQRRRRLPVSIERASV